MPIVVVTPPPVEPVSTEQAIEWCRALPHEAALLDGIIKATRARAEHLTQRAFVQRTLRWSGPSFIAYRHGWRLGGWIEDPVSLPQPVISISSVAYVDADNAEQTIDPADYYFDPARGDLEFRRGFVQPTFYQGRLDAARVEFVAGYAPVDVDGEPDYRANLPAELLTWMQIMIGTYYAQREAFAEKPLNPMPHPFLDGLLDALILPPRFT